MKIDILLLENCSGFDTEKYQSTTVFVRVEMHNGLDNDRLETLASLKSWKLLNFDHTSF